MDDLYTQRMKKAQQKKLAQFSYIKNMVERRQARSQASTASVSPTKTKKQSPKGVKEEDE